MSGPGADVASQAAGIQERHRGSLKECVDFWLAHSLDKTHGGYFNCLDRDGSVYDTKKHVWLQGRQVWTMGRLYNDREEYRTAEVLAAVKLGVDFLRTHAHRAADGRVYFCLAGDGKPIKLQRKVFAECFYCMALSEYARAIKASEPAESAKVFAEACAVFEAILRFSKDLSLVGQVALEGTAPSRALGIPMITLNVICELRCYNGDRTLHKKKADECISLIKLHVKPELKAVLEVVGPDGEPLDTPEGRVLNCGHAIEAGWFIMDYANRYCDKEQELVDLGLQMIEMSLETGWDRQHGGIFYFLDRTGHSAEQLEWPMKLWWVHNEAMVATLMAYTITKDIKWWTKFVEVNAYTMSHFPDDAVNNIPVEQPPAFGGCSAPPQSMQVASGAWFGYLTREGKVSQRFKGGPYKGFFHVPRCLHLCAAMLDTLAAAK